MYEEANVLPRPLLKKATSLGLAGLKALELASSPTQQRQIDVAEQRPQRRRCVPPVVLDPTSQEWIESMGNFHQRQVRLATKFQSPDRAPYVFQRRRADRWIKSTEQLLVQSIFHQTGPETISEEIE